MKTNNLAVLVSIIFVFLNVIDTSVISQTQWQRTIGGSALDEPSSIIQTLDGGYAVAGYTQSTGAGLWDFYIIKLNNGGTLEWSRTAGGTGFENVHSIIQTADSGYLSAGYTNSFGAGNYDIFIIKLSSSGVFQWSKTVGGAASESVNSMTRTSDGGFVVAGSTISFGAGGYDMYIVKFDAGGSLQWSRTIGGSADDFAYSIIQTSVGGFAVAGATNSFGAGGRDMYIVKLNSSGSIEWSRTAGGGGIDIGSSIIQTTEGKFAVAGATYSFGAGYIDGYIVNLDTGGTLEWSRTIGGIGEDYISSIIQASDGAYIALGTKEPDLFLVELNAKGVVQWSKILGGGNYEYSWDLKRTADGGYVAAGSTVSFGAGSYDMYIVKLDSNVNTCSNIFTAQITSDTGGIMTSPTSTVNIPSSIVMTHTPVTSGGGTVIPVCLVSAQPVSNEMPEHYRLFQNYPNPFNPNSKIKYQIADIKLGNQKVKLAVYSALGQEIEVLVNGEQSPGTYEVEFDASNCPSGVYFYKLIAAGYEQTKRMVLIK